MNIKLMTLIIPGRNEAPNIPILLKRVDEVFKKISGWKFEVLWIDDGSFDETQKIIVLLQKEYPWLTLIKLAKNYGHQAALEAGIMQANGEAVISMDGDCQHPPEEIPNMLHAYEEGADVVQMIRQAPAKGLKGIFSKSFYRLFKMMTDVDIAIGGADFRLINRRIINILKEIPEREKFLRALLPTLGFTQKQLFYQEADRHAGTPSYTFKYSFKLARKVLFDFSMVPLRLVFYSGLFLAALSFVIGLSHIINKLINGASITPGFTDIIVSILFLSGCILGSVGIIGRYIQLILDQIRGRPNYLIAEIQKGKDSE